MQTNPEALIADFQEVARLAGIVLPAGSLSFEILPAPHTAPTELPRGKSAVYVFALPEQCLKVGKAGPRSKARFTSHHYHHGSSPSNLAKSLLKFPEQFGLAQTASHEIGAWIKEKTYRINFLLDVGVGVAALNLLEAFLQCRLNPHFEGFASQQK
jgi:hypothetical protein